MNSKFVKVSKQWQRNQRFFAGWISWNCHDCRHYSLFSPVLGSSYSCLALWSSLCYVVIWQCYFWHPFMCFFEFKIEARFTRCYSWNSPNLNSWTLTQKEIRPVWYDIWKRWNNLKIRQSTVYYAVLLGRWDKRIVDQESDVPSIIFFILFIDLCPIHVVTCTLISNLATDYIQKRTGQALLFSFEYNLSPNLISK